MVRLFLHNLLKRLEKYEYCSLENSFIRSNFRLDENKQESFQQKTIADIYNYNNNLDPELISIIK